MVTSSSSFPSSPSTSSTSATDYTRSASDDTLGSAKPDLMDRVVRGAHETVDQLADKAEPVLQRLQEGAGSATDTLNARVDQARAMGDEWAESLRASVRDNPLAAVGTALALGLIIARLSR